MRSGISRKGFLKRRPTFGVLTTLQKDVFHSSYHAGLLSGIFRRSGETNAGLKLIALSRDGYPDLSAIFHEHALDGLIILTWRWIHPKIADLIEHTRDDRIVVVNDPLSGLAVNMVYTDVHAGMLMAVRHLVKRKLKKIGMIHGPKQVLFKPNGKRVKLPFIDTLLKEKAFKDALKEKNIPLRKDWLRSAAANSEEAGHVVMRKWIRDKKLPAAVICGNDDLAFGAIKAMKEKGIDCPNDIAVIGFDDNGRAKGFTPPLTTIRQPLLEMGKDTVNILLEKAASYAGNPACRTYSPKLIVRKTA